MPVSTSPHSTRRTTVDSTQGVAITHPDKVLFPDDGITKGEVAAYYESVASMLVEHIRGRPLTLERFPQGIAEKGFLQKNLGKGAPPWLERIEVPKQGGELEVWNTRPSEDEYQRLKSDRHYGIDRDRLRPADFTTRPEDGDLIIINPRFIHAVRPVHHTPRITLSSFIGYFGEQSPLIYWS